MSNPFADVRLDVDARQATGHSGVPREDRPFTIALLGDFSGRESRGEHRTDLSGLRPIAIDRDNFDAVLSRVAPRLRVALGGSGVAMDIRIDDLDHFHPDHLYDTVAVFKSLRDLRARLSSPATFRKAAAELRTDPPPPVETTAPPSAAALSGGLLDQILAETPSAPGGATRAPETDLQAYIRSIIGPHLVPTPDPRQADMITQVDAAVGEQMRMLLHHPHFQALEAAWRSVFFLIRRLETGPQLRIYLIDVSRDELRTDLDAGRDLRQSALYRLLVRDAVETVGGTPWSLLVGNYAFGADLDDLQLLGRTAELARAAGAPWLSGAEPDLVVGSSSADADDADSGDPAWAEARRHPAAAFLGLVFPRFLLRLPYGADSDPCDRFQFEEVEQPPQHEDLLWGNSAFAAALLIAESFSQAGWQMRPGMMRDVTGLPLHLVRSNGDVSAQPCAEILMTEPLAERILDAGVMPLASIKERDAVRMVQFRSAASPPTPLAGPWQHSS